MRLATVYHGDRPRTIVRRPSGDLILLDVLLDSDIGLPQALEQEAMDAIRAALPTAPSNAVIDGDAITVAPYRNPPKILGIGLNYRAHAGDLGENAPRTTPASFIKGGHTIVGPGESIQVPDGIGRVTSEAEVALVIGRPCYRVGVDEALSYLAGIVAVLDQTAETVLLENPRYLTRVKNYPTFFSFGPEIITMDEVREHIGDLANLRVATIHNDRVHRQDTVAGMTFSPAELLSFHSHTMPFYPGDLLSTGTPGAVGIVPGDRVRCELGDGLTALENPVAAGPSGEIMSTTASTPVPAP